MRVWREEREGDNGVIILQSQNILGIIPSFDYKG